MTNLEKMLAEADLPSYESDDWLEQALAKIDKFKLNHDERLVFEMALARHGSMMEMRELDRKEGEKKTTLRFVKKLQSEGFENKYISELTGLSLEELESL